MTLKERYLASAFHRVFNFKTEENKGRSLLLINSGIANIAGALVSGALYTAFLAENGIDIVRVGIISFIPYISWTLSIFSPMILAKLRKRQKILLANDYIYYTCIVLATTIMPLFVHDSTQKTIWFAVLLFIGHVSNALVGSGYTSWLLRFVPKDGRDLNVYVSYSNLLSLVTANLTGIVASVVADALAGSEHRFWLLFGLRAGAFLLYMIGSNMIYLVPKEKPVEQLPERVLPFHVLTEPIKYKPFLLTALITVCWGISANLNGSTYNYYLLQTVKAPMSFLYIGSVTGMLSSLFLSGFFRKYVDRTSPYRIMAVVLVGYTILEMMYAFVQPGRVWLYCILTAMSGLIGVGYSMGYNSLFYRHIPENANKDLYATFWNLTANLSALIGSGLGTWILAQFEAHGVYHFLGMDFYGSQLLCGIKVFFFTSTLIYVAKVGPVLHRIEQNR